MHSIMSICTAFISAAESSDFIKKCFLAHVQHFMDVASMKIKSTLGTFVVLLWFSRFTFTNV